MGLDDPARFRQRFRDELDRLDDADIADADKDAIHDFIRARDDGLAVSSLEQYCKQLRLAAGFSETPISEIDLDGARDLFFEIRTTTAARTRRVATDSASSGSPWSITPASGRANSR